MLDSDDNTTSTTDTDTAAEPAPRKRAPRKAAAKKTTQPALPTTEASATDDAPAAEAPAPAPRKRAPRKAAAPRLAAEAPAGEPGTSEAGSPDAADAAPAPAKKAAKRAPRKAAAATAALAASDTASASDSAEAAPAKAPRKRAAKKAAPAAKAAAAKVSEPATTDDTSTTTAAGAPGVLFMPPAATTEAEKPKRRRPAKKAAAAPADSGDAATPEGDADPNATEDTSDADSADPEDIREAAIEQASGARRRRRRGRRGRGGGGARTDADSDGSDDEDDSDDQGSADEAADTSESDSGTDDSEGSSSSSRRRRRRRRTETGDGSTGPDDPPNTVTHVREPKKGKEPRDDGDDGVRGVKGSTRLEAKRQRRRDGRETNRRRAPILTEAEFLARRESVDRVMAVRQAGDRTQIAVLEDDILVEHYVTRASATSYVGNVYVGRVQNVLPSMEAAFIDIGKGRNGVLYAGEVNWDAAGLEGKSRAIEQALKSGDSVLVQVTKDPIGHKGARLTSQISLPGRFLVLVPGGGMTGISRRLPDTERHRLKAILKKIVPEEAGVIVRTAAEGASEEDLTRDVDRLVAQWEQIKSKSESTKSAPALLHGEPDIAIRVVRDVFNEDFKSLVVEGDEAWTTVSDYISGVAPDLAERVSRHTKDTDLFHDLRVDEQLAKALDRKVWLPSGGSLVIDRTEAMTVVDVNTGKFVGSGGNLEQTVTRNNLEAAEEIVRQLRLRDVGGIVVIDFIDMVLESNRELVLRRLTECLGRDRTKHQVAEVTSLGLVQMTRKRVGEGLLEAFSETCEHCHGRGVILHSEPVDKPSGGSSDFDDDRPKGKRKRGGRGGQSATTPDAPEVPAVLPEQREAATAAIAAIHRAAEGDKDESDGGLVAELASGLFAAALGAEADAEPKSSGAARSSAPVETDTAADRAAASGDDAAPEADTAPAPRRRRRVATRPTAAPSDSEPAVVVVDPVESPAPVEPTVEPASEVVSVPDAEPVSEQPVNGADEPASAPRRRRRTASRPAGPPTV